jgi:hypothetical protein
MKARDFLKVIHIFFEKNDISGILLLVKGK